MSDSEPDSGSDEESAIEAARKEVIDAMARSMEVYGFSQSYGRLYGILFFANEPVSLDELTTESGYAKSTVSTAMKSLQGIHFVHRRSVSGEGKKAFFEAETDWWYVFQELLHQEIMRELRIMGRALDDAVETFEQSETEQAARDLEKVRQLKQLFDQSEQLVELFTDQSMKEVVSMMEQIGPNGEHDGKH